MPVAATRDEAPLASGGVTLASIWRPERRVRGVSGGKCDGAPPRSRGLALRRGAVLCEWGDGGLLEEHGLLELGDLGVEPECGEDGEGEVGGGAGAASGDEVAVGLDGCGGVAVADFLFEAWVAGVGSSREESGGLEGDGGGADGGGDVSVVVDVADECEDGSVGGEVGGAGESAWEDGGGEGLGLEVVGEDVAGDGDVVGSGDVEGLVVGDGGEEDLESGSSEDVGGGEGLDFLEAWGEEDGGLHGGLSPGGGWMVWRVVGGAKGVVVRCHVGKGHYSVCD